MRTRPVIILDFKNKRASQMTLGDDAGRARLEHAVAESRKFASTAVGATPPPRRNSGR